MYLVSIDFNRACQELIVCYVVMVLYSIWLLPFESEYQ